MLTAENFLNELQKIILSQPKLTSHILYCENCQYGDQLFWCKDMSYCFDCAKSNSCIYVYDSIMMVSCIDCDYGAESQLCYESVDPIRCFNCDFIENCVNMRDCAYCYDCSNCNDVFGCVHLKNKSYCIFNRQLTQENYEDKIKYYKSLPVERILELFDKVKQRYPWTQTNAANNENTEYGNYIYQNKNCYLCFDAFSNQDCNYLYDSHFNSNCQDFTYSYDSEISYEAVDADKLFNSTFVVYCGNCQDSNYIFNSQDCKNCLGCVGLSHKQYCILNRQFTKEDYEKTSQQILRELKDKNLGWGDLNF